MGTADDNEWAQFMIMDGDSVELTDGEDGNWIWLMDGWYKYTAADDGESGPSWR